MNDVTPPSSQTAHNPVARASYTANIVLDIILTLLTCGLFYIWIQRRQILALNYLLKKERYSFFRWCLLTLITCGIYHIYFEFMMAQDMRKLNLMTENEALISTVCAIFGLTIVADILIQVPLNKHFGYDSV